jgi:uncharacterized protein
MNAIITNNLDKIQSLCEKYKVKELYAFGSVTDDKKFTAKSDVDLLVEFDKKNIPEEDFADYFFDLADSFEKLFKRKVDLMTANSLQNKYFIASVNESKTRVYVA